MARGDSTTDLTSPAAVAAYLVVVGSVLVFQRLGWHPSYLAGALLMLPWLGEHGLRGDDARRPRWWHAHVAAATLLATLAWAAVAVQAISGPWATPALWLVVPLTPVLVPAYWVLGTPSLGGELPHLPAAVAILTPVYGLALQRVRLERWEERQRRVRVARRRINAALRDTGRIERGGSGGVASAERPSGEVPSGPARSGALPTPSSAEPGIG